MSKAGDFSDLRAQFAGNGGTLYSPSAMRQLSVLVTPRHVTSTTVVAKSAKNS
jgi:hypothetical protein